MKRNKLLMLVSLIILVSMILSACTTATVAPVTEQPMATEAATEAPTEVPPTEAPKSTRHGGWVDEIVVSVVAADSAVTQLKAGAIDVFAAGLSSADLKSIQDAGLNYTKQNGLYYDMIFNPAEFTNGEFNPFSNRKIREATNYLVDRDYINQEIYAGGALAKFFAITTQFPDYADLADVAKRLESKYAYDPAKAKEIIATEMTGMGATLGADGKWQYKGKPVTLIFLIRPDSDGTRKPLGDYFANQLETVGFTVDRQYKKASEAGPIWQGNAVDGGWHIYTAAWSATIIDRDQSNIFQEMYLPSSGQGLDVFVANKADPEFLEIGNKLATGNYKDLAERRTLMTRAMELSLEDSLQLFLIDGKNYTPYVKNVEVTADLAAGVEGSQIWPFTIRFADKEGGQLKWATSDLFTEPWNPIAGTNWAWDQAVIRATASGDVMYDPYTGLLWPLMAEKAEVTVQEGNVVGKTLDWVDLKFEKEIKVPADAFVDWDAKTQKWITASEKYPDGVTAKRKTVTTYPADLWTTVKWHDGSNITMGDLMAAYIIFFDRAKPESVLYDESSVPNFEAFMGTFKGFKIDSTDPLVLEYYSDFVNQDAELNFNGLWPNPYGFGEISWPVLALGNYAETNKELAYSIDKSTALTVEQTSFVGGPSLAILSADLDKAIAESYIPYAPTLSQYVTADEVKARYAAVKAFYAKQSHFWIGTCPYYLDQAKLTEKNATLKTYADYRDLSSRWSQFVEPKLADVQLDGPGQVKIGDEATYDVFVTFKDAPYPQAEIKEVKFLLYNSKNEIVAVEAAVAVADGHYQVVLSKETTSKLEAGSNKIEVAVIPLPVSIPTFATIQFVTAP